MTPPTSTITNPTPVPVQTSAGDGDARYVAGIALVSFSTLLLELALTRLFSVVLFYHFAFLAISIALLGLGAGGVFAFIRKAQLQDVATAKLAQRCCLGSSVAILVALEVVLHVSVSLNLTGGNFLRLTLVYLAAAIPFFFTGLMFSAIFAREPERIAHLYGADLIGGAAACLAVVPLLNLIGGPNAIVFAALAMACAAAIWNPKGRRVALGLAGLFALVVAANVALHGRLIDIVYAKGMRRDKPWVLYSRWNAISRVEVDQTGDSKAIVIDADAATAIMNADPAHWEDHGWKKNLMSAAPAVVNVLRPQGDYAIIGPGGGVDVLRALANGSKNVTAIEINGIIANNIMRGKYADYAYHLYERPEVHLHVQDGRSFIRNSKDKYDVIQMTLVDTWASTSAGAFALSENNLYTVEAFKEYFDHLKPDGMIAITRWEFKEPREALRVVSQGIEALREMRISDPESHFIVVSDGVLNADGKPVVVIIKRTPFSWQEERKVLLHVKNTKNLYPLFTPAVFTSLYRGGTVIIEGPCLESDTLSSPPFDRVFLPEVPPNLPPVDGSACDYGGRYLFMSRSAPPEVARPFQQLIEVKPPSSADPLQRDPLQQLVKFWSASSPSPSLADVSNYPYDISPVHDSAPFFFFTFKTSQLFHQILHPGEQGIDWKVNLGVAVLFMLLVISLLAVTAFLILPLAFHAPARGIRILPLFYFVAVGLGYILVEITFIQRLVLFLGHPTYALTVVVFLLLLSSGAGSLAARRWIGFRNASQKVLLPLLLIVITLAMYVPLLPRLLGAEVGLPFALKLMISASVLAPLGFAMGMPFPTGLMALSATKGSAVEWAWAMNAASSVLGSVLAIVIAVHFGLGVTLAFGAGAYLAAALLSRIFPPPAQAFTT